MRTSIDIPDRLIRRAKKLARQRGITFRQLVLDGLRAVVGPVTKSAAYRMQDRSFGKGGLVEGLVWSDSERIDALVYGGRE
jgi:hypothetical protein